MIDLLDSHLHTVASGHAYSSIGEMITAGKKKGLQLLAFTEHAPSTAGSCCNGYFSNLKILPRKREDIWTLYGAEVNILNREGEIDLPENILKEMDVVVASIHPGSYTTESDITANTTACIRAMQNPFVNILGHPDDGRFPLEYGEIVRAAKAYHVLLEVNNSSFQDTSFRRNTMENCRGMLLTCMKYDAPVIINSDAHVDLQVGEHADGWKIVHEVGFPEELVVNTSLDRYFEFVNFNRL